MRVTFVLPFTSVEGGSRVVAIYAEKLAARGHEVTVVSCGARPRRLRHRVKEWALRAARGQFQSPSSPTHFDHVPHLHRVIPGSGPIRPRDVPDGDVIVATWWETAEWVREMPRSKGAKVHLIQHDERVFSDDPSKKARVAATWGFDGFSRIVVSGWLQELGREEFGVETTLIGNAVDTDLFDAPPRQRNQRPAVGLMYHARPFKGTDISLRAYAMARARVPELRLLAFGPEPELPQLPLPPGTDLLVMPPQAKIAEFYRSCDAYLFGSRCEGFGLPILEAMACRTPVIGTPTGAAPELISEGGGILVKPQDPESMADAIMEIATMPPSRWVEMSDAAYATARRHSWERCTHEFEAALRRAAISRSGGSAVLVPESPAAAVVE
jgi:glycosyltransferase involved in cell wall biosynthesis